MPADFRVVIPARYGSTRLAGKPLRKIIDKPMIQWVYEAAKASQSTEVIVATDSRLVADVVAGFGGQVCMTSEDHETGSDRLVEVAHIMGWSDDTIIVNLQGDEPLMPAENITQVATNLLQSGCDMATLHKTINHQQALDSNQVKLVHDLNGRALYFSRATIPFDRDGAAQDYCGHVGLYAYRVGFLKIFTALPECPLEQREKLEQLRGLYNGYSIHTDIACEIPGPGIDTEADLQRVTALLRQQ